MHVDIPRLRGSSAYIVEPGAESKATEALEDYKRSMNSASLNAAAIASVTAILTAGLVGAWCRVNAPEMNAPEMTALTSILAIILMLVLAVAVGGSVARLVILTTQKGAQSRMDVRLYGHVRDLELLRGFPGNGYASPESEWKAAGLASEAARLRRQASERQVPSGNEPLTWREAGEINADIARLLCMAQKAEAKALSLLNPKRPARRRAALR